MALHLLNQQPPSGQDKPEQVALHLKQAINNLKGDFYDLETGGVNYAAMKGSEGFENYKASAALLQRFDLNLLQSQAAKLAFWINIYNALTVHGIVELGVNNSVREISHFFENVAYQIGDQTFSLDQIEHGILRGNQKKHLFARRPFGSKDPRAAHVLPVLEPRIHFTLVCGSKSCPPIGTYQEEKIEDQLKLAASSFVNSDNVVLDRAKHKLSLSKILDWYGKDFGDKAALIRFLAQYRKAPDDKAFLLEQGTRLAVSYQEYDWSLNH
jgi:hypothetical protein